MLIRLCAWHTTYGGRPKLLGICMGALWKRVFWQVALTHGMCSRCAKRFRQDRRRRQGL
jgi:hypothetical protein